ncbi:MAG: RNA 2',3'-cyclic phosphodiesterase [Sulfolobaceae archaeon]
MRLFIAIEVTNIPKILELIEGLKRTGADIKLVESNNLHITLVFLGEVEESKLGLVKAALHDVNFSSFKIKLNGVGAFPSVNRPKVVWVGITEGFQKLKEIRSILVKGLRSRGIKPEDEKEFVAHLTLGRVKSPVNLINLIKFINENMNIEVGEIIVDSIKLFKSTLTPKGPIYDILDEVKAIDRRGSFEVNKAK